jgi:hypothetical protein
MAKRAATTSCALVDGRPVFMDVRDDAYFTLEPDEEASFLTRLSMDADDRENGLEAADQRIEIVSCGRAEASILDQAEMSRRPAVSDILIIWRLLARVRRSIRFRPIADVLAEIECAHPAQETHLGFPAVAMRFTIARRFVPIPRNCLTDSITLLHWLARNGERATLVFGVKLDPFAAHCWVQTDGILLNDHAEHVERFTPVRAVQCTVDLP